MPGSVDVPFAWDANVVGDNVLGYRINRGVQSGVYTTSKDVGNVLAGFDTITVSGTYFWALTAQNASGISTPSNELTEFVAVPIPVPPGPARMMVG